MDIQSLPFQANEIFEKKSHVVVQEDVLVKPTQGTIHSSDLVAVKNCHKRHPRVEHFKPQISLS